LFVYSDWVWVTVVVALILLTRMFRMIPVS